MRMNGAELIASERKRQIADEGYTAEHDDEHGDGELLRAASAYLEWGERGAKDAEKTYGSMPDWWPWEPRDWKPESDIRNLTKAGALIAAEIDRLMRKTK